jgi:hypothetical protein
MKFTHEEILRAIVASGILEKQLQDNLFLGELLGNPNSSNIRYGLEHVPDIYQREVFERRIKTGLMQDGDEVARSNAEGLRAVLTFTENYPENYVFMVVFNCTDEHFTVWCGLLDNHIEVLCALKGGHIPDYLFEKKTE